MLPKDEYLTYLQKWLRVPPPPSALIFTPHLILPLCNHFCRYKCELLHVCWVNCAGYCWSAGIHPYHTRKKTGMLITEKCVHAVFPAT